MVGFLAAETLCDADVNESIVAREMQAAEQKHQAFRTHHQQSHGMCTTQFTWWSRRSSVLKFGYPWLGSG